MKSWERADLIKAGVASMQKRLAEVLFKDFGDAVMDVVSDTEGKIDSPEWEAFCIALMDDALELTMTCYTDIDDVEVGLVGKASCHHFISTPLQDFVADFIDDAIQEKSSARLDKAIDAFEEQINRLREAKKKCS